MTIPKRRIESHGVVLASTLSSDSLRNDWGVEPVPGMLYVTTRAISSRVNANYDGWPADELEKAYKSFVGRGIYVEHNNWDPSRSRGVILGVKLHKSKLANNEQDYWVELLEEIDAQNFPKLAEAVMSGELKSVSMGADVGFTICSVCSNKAHDPSEYCEHIAYQKGQHVIHEGKKKLAWEDCYEINFFEISHVFDPADESADVIGRYLHTGSRVASIVRPLRGRDENLENYYGRLQKAASKTADTRVPTKVETLRDDSEDIDELSPSEMVAPNLELDLETLQEFRDYIDKVEEQLKDEASEDEQAESEGMTSEEAEVEPQTQDTTDSEQSPEVSEEQMADEDMDMEMDDEMDDEFDPNDIAMDDEDDFEDDDMDEDMDDMDEDMDDEDEDMDEDEDDEMSKTSEMELEDEDDEDDESGTHIHLHSKKKAMPFGTPLYQKGAADAAAGMPPAMPTSIEYMEGYESVQMAAVASKRRSPMNRFQQMRAMKRRAGDLDVDYDQTSTMNTDGEYDAGDSETVDAPKSIAANDQVDADAVEDVTKLDQTMVKGEPGQSEVTVARKKRQAQMKRRAEEIVQTDVPSLDANPATEADTRAADATTDVTTPVDQGNQLALADRPDDVNDGSETGFSQDNPPSDATSPSDLTYEAARKAARRQFLAAMEVYDIKEQLGLVDSTRRVAEIAKLEKLHPKALEGMRMAYQEVAKGRTASRRVSTAGTRFPGMGRSNRVLAREDLDPVDDTLITL